MKIKAIEQGIGVKAIEGAIKAIGEPTPDDLALINEYALAKLGAGDVAVYTMQVANDQVDRDGERFSLEVLQDFASTLPGKGLLEGHDWGPVGIGRFFKAWIEPAPGGVNWLMGRAYLLREDTEAAQMIVKLNGGIAAFVSIGFFAPERAEVVDAAGRTYREYRRGLQGQPAEALEASLVFLGAQYDATVVKKMTAALAEKYGKAETGMITAFVRAVDKLVAIVTGKEGRVLSGKNFTKLEGAHNAIGEVLDEARREPPAEGQSAGAGKDATAVETVVGQTTEPQGPATTEGDEMDPKVIEQLTAQIATLTEKLTAMDAKLEASTAKVGELTEALGKVDERIKAMEEGATKAEEQVAEFAEKMVERVENIEVALGTPRAASTDVDGGDGEPKPKSGGGGKKTTREIFGDLFRLQEWTGQK
jgi:hypothetical protein